MTCLTHSHPRYSPKRRERGQILPLFGLSLVAILAVLGLVVDGSTLYVNRRTAQNAADAAAMAGTHALILATSPDTTVGTAVCTFIRGNTFTQQPTATANFVNTAGTSVGSINLNTSCASGTPASTTIPTTAAGVSVTSSIGPFNTYLVGMLGISTLTASASATSMVNSQQLTSFDAGSAPFIVCGIATTLNAGGTMDVLHTSGGVAVGPPYSLNSSAVGQTFLIHSPGGSHGSVTDCSAGSSFKGLADTSANAGITSMPNDLTWLNGTHAGPTRSTVNGTNGCVPPNNTGCVMMVPIAISSSGSQMYCVLWAAMTIATTGANTHTGTLVGSYTVGGLTTGTRTYGWTFGSGSGNSYVSTASVGLTQ